MTEVLLIRHGETAWNVEQRIQGQRDIALNAQGELQALALGRTLASENLDAVFASDLRRTMQTAEAIAASHGLTVQPDAGLRERRFGAFEGLTHADIRARFPAEHAAWRARHADARFPSAERPAETLREFYLRAVDAITRLAANAGPGKVAIVTHGGVLDCMYRAATGTDLAKPRDFEILNAGINRLIWNGRAFRVAQWGGNAHLRAPALDEIR